MTQTTKLSWGPECGPDRRWIEEQLRARAGEETSEETRKLARVDAREAGSGYTDDLADYPGDLWSGVDDR